jgi:hypothetical protein
MSPQATLASMQALIAAGAGFLLAVLWFDLMFDVQMLRFRDDEVPEVVLASIAGYYRRVTTEARPLNRLVALVMVVTLVAIVLQATGDDVPRWVSVVSAVAAAAAIGLAATRTVPSAVRLGTRLDPVELQRWLARSVCRDHLVCVPLIATLLAVQLVWA